MTQTTNIRVKAHVIICTTLALIDHALQSSWSGYNVIAMYNGVRYDLYSDTTGAIHERLMRIVAPNIGDTDLFEVMDRKYNIAAKDLTNGWLPFDSYPTIDIDAADMDYQLQRAYNLI